MNTVLFEVYAAHGFPKDGNLKALKNLKLAMRMAMRNNFAQDTKDFLHNAFVEYRVRRSYDPKTADAILTQLAAPKSDAIGKGLAAAAKAAGVKVGGSVGSKPRGGGGGASGSKRKCHRCGSEARLVAACPKNAGGGQ